jgi:atypical dual specificity phosphatase
VGFDQVTDTIYIGSRITSVEDYRRLRDEGVRACVDMKREGADPWDFEAFLWLPTVDHDPPSLVHLQMGIGFLRECERQRLPVLVHCMAGVGRSCALVLAYLLAYPLRGSTPREALDFLTSRRPVVNPTSQQVASAVEAARTFHL